MQDLYTFLEQQGITYERYEHPAVRTCDEAERLLPPLPGAHTKNLLLRDKKDQRFLLVVVGYDKSVDLKTLGQLVDTKGLRFASPEQLRAFLGVEPGSATILGLIADTAGTVEVIFDEPIWQADALQCHPLVNTATLVIPHKGIATFLEATQHTVRVMDVPARL